MAQILVRNLSDGVVERLKRRAASQGRSLQAEVKGILEQAASVDFEEARRLASRVRSRFGGKRFSDSAKLVRQGRAR
jgi:plasmid stability protein